MLNLETCEKLEAMMVDEIAKRRKLGGYSPDAHTILTLCELVNELIRHIRESQHERRRPSAPGNKAT